MNCIQDRDGGLDAPPSNIYPSNLDGVHPPLPSMSDQRRPLCVTPYSARTIAAGLSSLLPKAPALFMAAVVVLCAIYANLAYVVTSADHLQWFPPFKTGISQNANRHLGGEHLSVARNLVAGHGYANPFPGPDTGPTAWIAPAFPTLLGFLLWLTSNDTSAVAAIVIVLEEATLIFTALLALSVRRYTVAGTRAWPLILALMAELLLNFQLAFQVTHDGWLVMLALDLLIAGSLWWQISKTSFRAWIWGACGALCALVNPATTLAWATATGMVLFPGRRYKPFLLAALGFSLTIAPWTGRNYFVFGRLVPVKSNLPYELYQSQCLQPNGVLGARGFGQHPFGNLNPESIEYRALGEVTYMDTKWRQFVGSVWYNPFDYVRRVGQRFLAATLFESTSADVWETENHWWLGIHSLIRPLAFLSLLYLLLACRSTLLFPQWVVVMIYISYLIPYVLVSYYSRYSFPLVGINALLISWACDGIAADVATFVKRIGLWHPKPAA